MIISSLYGKDRDDESPSPQVVVVSCGRFLSFDFGQIVHPRLLLLPYSIPHYLPRCEGVTDYYIQDNTLLWEEKSCDPAE